MPNIETNKALSIKQYIEEMVKNHYRLEDGEITAPNRNQRSANARFVVWYILRKEFKWSTPFIGQLYQKDHSTVIHGLKVIENNGLKDDAKIIIGKVQDAGFSTYPQT